MFNVAPSMRRTRSLAFVANFLCVYRFLYTNHLSFAFKADYWFGYQSRKGRVYGKPYQGCGSSCLASADDVQKGSARIAAEWIAKAAAEGVELLVFPEGFVPGFPHG